MRILCVTAIGPAAAAVVETAARLALFALVLVVFAVRLVFVVIVRAAMPRAAPGPESPALGRLPEHPSA